MDIIQQRRQQFDYLHGDKGGLDKLCQLLDDYTVSYGDIAQYFEFASGSTYIVQLLKRLGLDRKRGYLTFQERRDNFNKVYKLQGGLTKLIEMLEAQASDEEIAEQFGIDEKRVGQVLRRLKFYRQDFRVKPQLSSKENFDQRYKQQGGVAQLMKMAHNPLLSLQDIAGHFGYQDGSGVWRALKRLGLKYVPQDSNVLTARRLNFDKKYRSMGGIEKLEAMISDGASTREIAQHFGLSCGGVRHAIKRLFPRE